ncbi:MAG: hypothetical protein IPJ17_12355 [Holophagales bacterium]|nr:MAG: hypothetical protein IPJ17_12355 [Holophagales bacterium]
MKEPRRQLLSDSELLIIYEDLARRYKNQMFLGLSTFPAVGLIVAAYFLGVLTLESKLLRLLLAILLLVTASPLIHGATQYLNARSQAKQLRTSISKGRMEEALHMARTGGPAREE